MLIIFLRIKYIFLAEGPEISKVKKLTEEFEKLSLGSESEIKEGEQKEIKEPGLKILTNADVIINMRRKKFKIHLEIQWNNEDMEITLYQEFNRIKYKDLRQIAVEIYEEKCKQIIPPSKIIPYTRFVNRPRGYMNRQGVCSIISILECLLYNTSALNFFITNVSSSYQPFINFLIEAAQRYREDFCDLREKDFRVFHDDLIDTLPGISVSIFFSALFSPVVLDKEIVYFKRLNNIYICDFGCINIRNIVDRKVKYVYDKFDFKLGPFIIINRITEDKKYNLRQYFEEVECGQCNVCSKGKVYEIQIYTHAPPFLIFHKKFTTSVMDTNITVPLNLQINSLVHEKSTYLLTGLIFLKKINNFSHVVSIVRCGENFYICDNGIIERIDYLDIHKWFTDKNLFFNTAFYEKT